MGANFAEASAQDVESLQRMDDTDWVLNVIPPAIESTMIPLQRIDDTDWVLNYTKLITYDLSYF